MLTFDCWSENAGPRRLFSSDEAVDMQPTLTKAKIEWLPGKGQALAKNPAESVQSRLLAINVPKRLLFTSF